MRWILVVLLGCLGCGHIDLTPDEDADVEIDAADGQVESEAVEEAADDAGSVEIDVIEPDAAEALPDADAPDADADADIAEADADVDDIADVADVPDVPPGMRVCSELCGVGSGDGLCDDGAAGADTSVCGFGTDCTDCGERYWAPEPSAECNVYWEDFEEYVDRRWWTLPDGPLASGMIDLGPGASFNVFVRTYNWAPTQERHGLFVPTPYQQWTMELDLYVWRATGLTISDLMALQPDGDVARDVPGGWEVVGRWGEGWNHFRFTAGCEPGSGGEGSLTVELINSVGIVIATAARTWDAPCSRGFSGWGGVRLSSEVGIDNICVNSTP